MRGKAFFPSPCDTEGPIPLTIKEFLDEYFINIAPPDFCLPVRGSDNFEPQFEVETERSRIIRTEAGTNLLVLLFAFPGVTSLTSMNYLLGIVAMQMSSPG